MRVLLLLVGLLFAVQSAAKENAEGSAHVTADTRQLDLTPYVQVLFDSEHRLSIQSLTDANLAHRFHHLSDFGKSFGFEKSVLWLKFSIFVDIDVKSPLLLQFDFPLIDELQLFEYDREGILQPVRMTGDRFPFSQREIAFRNFLFHIDQPPGSSKTYYMRLRTDGSLQVALSLWTASALIENVDASGLAYGIYYGVMIILMLTAAVAYLKLRDFLFLSYALYLLSFLLFQFSLNGFSFQYLWQDLNGWVNRLNSMTVGLVVIFGFIFCGVFLRVWQRRDLFMYLYNLFIGIGVLSVLLSLFGNIKIAVQIAAFAGILLPPVVIVSNIAAVISGYRPARFFLIAWGIFLSGVFFAGLLYFGIVERNFFTVNAMQIASLIEIIILGYVLMDHVRRLTIQKEAALMTTKESLQQLNEGLESKVAARTRELVEKNRLLSDMALRDSMTGLLNHNTIIEHLHVMSKTALRYGHNLSVIMIDIDHFKDINDRFGHPTGDTVILAVAQVLKHSIRASDSCGRYGGEEFLLLLPETTGENAYELAQGIRRKIMQIALPDIGNSEITASFGISVFDPAHADTDLIREADQALYQAKNDGRNQVVLRSNSSTHLDAV